MTIKQRPTSLAPQLRFVTLQTLPDRGSYRAAMDIEARTMELAFASETPVDMWYGTEVLSCTAGAMRMGQRQSTLPLLFNHDRCDLLGVVESIRLDADRIARAVVRFGRDERGEWAMQQALDGVLVNVSFMYRVFKWEEDTEAETLTAMEWEVYEISLVTVPADASVGAGRSADASTENGVQIVQRAAAATAPLPKAAGVHPAPVARSLSQPVQESEMKFRTHRLQNAVSDATTGGGAPSGTGTTTTAGTALEATTVDTTGSRAAAGNPVDVAMAERQRVSEIEAVCSQYKLSDELRRSLVQRGATVADARACAADIVLERARASTGQPAADMGASTNPDLSNKDKARYSMLRAIRACMNNDWKDAGFELECSNAIAKASGRAAGGPSGAAGFFMPTNVPFAARAAYTVGTPGAGTTGGTLVGTQLLSGSFIELLRNTARVMQLGATVLSGLQGPVDIPRQTGSSTAFWTGEGADTSESEATFDKVSMAMKHIGTWSLITRNMLMQATPDIDMLARADLLQTLALGIDLATMSGSGTSNQPLGIVNQAGVNPVIGGTNGAAITLDHLIQMETKAADSNAPEASMAYLSNAKVVGAIKTLKSTTGQYLWTGSPNGGRSGTPGEINGYPFARTKQARSNLTKGTSSGVCSEVFFGPWSEVVIGEWGVLEIVPNPYAAEAYKSGGLMLRAMQSVDVALRHGASFSVMTDALTA